MTTLGALYEDIIQLDFDDEKSARIAMDIVSEYKLRCDILKTSRGIHLYFKVDDTVKSQSVGVFNAIGLRCDIGLGMKNRVVPLRTTKDVQITRVVNGENVISTTKQVVLREWLQTYEDIEVLPAYFRPMGKHDYNLPKASARNQTLFEYILKLQMAGMTKDRQENKGYIYMNLLIRKETITRDEAFSEELFFDEKGRFLHDRFGNYMLSNCNIVRIDGLVNIYTVNHLYSNNPSGK